MRPSLEVRLGAWGSLPSASAAFTIPAWRQRPVPYLPIFHVVTARDRVFGLDGAWRTEPQLEQWLRDLLGRAERDRQQGQQPPQALP